MGLRAGGNFKLSLGGKRGLNVLSNNSLDVEALSYLSATSIIDTTTRSAANDFVVTLKSEGVWSKGKACSLFLSGNSLLSEALINLKYPTGYGSLTNNGTTLFTDANYFSNLGLKSTSTLFKADLGYTLASQGLHKDNFTLIVGVTDDTTDNQTGSVFIDNKPTGAPSAFIGKNSAGMNGGGFLQTNPIHGIGVPYLASVSSNGYISVVRDFHSTVPSTRVSENVTFDTNHSLFGGRSSGSINGSPVAIGFYWVSEYLTYNEIVILNAAVRTFWEAIGRKSTTKEVVFLGDSITFGYNSTNSANRFSRLYANSIGLVEKSCGLPGSLFRTSGSTNPSGYLRFPNLLNYDIYNGGKLVFIHGVNDCRNDSGATGANTADFQTKLTQRLQEARDSGLSGDQIIVASIPYVNDGTPQTRQDAYTAAALASAQATGCYYVDINAYMRANGGAALLDTDNIHPTDAGHIVIKDGLLTAAAV